MQRYHYLIFILGLLFTSAVGFDIYCWIAISANSGSFEIAREAYLSRFPVSIRNPVITTLLDTGLLIVAVSCFFTCRHHRLLQKPSRILLGLNALVIGWLLFTLL